MREDCRGECSGDKWREEDLENVRVQKKDSNGEKKKQVRLHNKPRVKALIKICFLRSGLLSQQAECRFVLAAEFIHCVRCKRLLNCSYVGITESGDGWPATGKEEAENK